MENVVYKAVEKMGGDYFETAWSPMLGDVSVDISKDTREKYRYSVFIRSKVSGNMAMLNGDGKMDDNGEVMVFVSKDASEKEWEKYANPDGTKTLEYYMETWPAEKRGPAYDYILDTIEDCIDFDKIAEVMKFLDWRWYMGIDYNSEEWKIIKSMSNNPELAAMTSGYFDKVPDTYEIHSQCLKLIDHVLEHSDKTEWKTSTGGFEVGFRCYPPEPGEEDDLEHSVDFYVRFVLEECSTLI